MKKTVKSIIDDIMEFHLGLSKYFVTLKDNVKDQRTEVLLDYLSRREKYVSNHLKKYLHDSHHEVLNMWINIAPDLPSDILSDCCKELDIYAPLAVEDIIDIAIHYDNCLIDFFSVLVNETECTNAEVMFSNFLNQAKSEERKLARDTSWFNDL